MNQRDKILVKKLDKFMDYKDDHPQWLKREIQEEFTEWISQEIKEGNAVEIDPVYNLRKYFYNRNTKRLWIETRFGTYELKAKKFHEQFHWEMNELHQTHLTNDMRKAMEFLHARGILKNKISTMLYHDQNRRDLKRVYWGSRLVLEKEWNELQKQWNGIQKQ